MFEDKVTAFLRNLGKTTHPETQLHTPKGTNPQIYISERHKPHNPNFLLNFILTPWSTVLLEKPTDCRQAKKFPTIYGNRRFITAFKTARHLSLS
jgi:hypothetical protein